MPARNTRKEYIKDGVYHLYNRGVEKRDIFLDSMDYQVFLKYLRSYLLPKDEVLDYGSRITINLHKDIDLLSFCLMPNHFHLLVKQNSEEAITQLMQGLLTRYTVYFNRKYKRVGSLFQGRYCAALVPVDEYLIHVSRYIHLNPRKLKKEYYEYPFSSYPYYLGNETASWVKPALVLDLIGGKKELDKFMKDSGSEYDSLMLGRTALDEENE